MLSQGLTDSPLGRILRIITNSSAVLSGILLTIAMLLTCFDVFQRIFLESRVAGVIEINAYLLVAVVFLALGYAQRTSQHVSMDVVLEKLPHAVGRRVGQAGMVVALVLLAWMVVATANEALESFRTQRVSFGSIRMTMWPFYAVVTYGLALFWLEMVRTLLENGATDDPARHSSTESASSADDNLSDGGGVI